ncbi:hypothetical protein GOP47_0000683 [Adiantum capillus-veneris]|uniref:Uncharacterized protein n=1 Tax=Adiantum capillus-veneris TaxID=13818 RepID=A0A9D4VEC4_ADICA|nr:hypothetical protein GOP47_0000683 [Adiantum capillus-veneris]
MISKLVAGSVRSKVIIIWAEASEFLSKYQVGYLLHCPLHAQQAFPGGLQSSCHHVELPSCGLSLATELRADPSLSGCGSDGYANRSALCWSSILATFLSLLFSALSFNGGSLLRALLGARVGMIDWRLSPLDSRLEP